jgi:hypothetical protein
MLCAFQRLSENVMVVEPFEQVIEYSLPFLLAEQSFMVKMLLRSVGPPSRRNALMVLQLAPVASMSV